MFDQKFYTGEINEIKGKINERYNWLKINNG